ncbi:hypothetical protein [Enterococcus phage VEsP-2]|nr:hypothetical protein [Enterococcus phage VEsP-2]
MKLGIKMYTLGQLLDTVCYGTKVRLANHGASDVITEFTMSVELEYKKEFELVEPYIENEVMSVAITSDAKLYIEIL